MFSDNGQSAEYFESRLNDENHPGHPLGYRITLVRRLTQEELCPDGWSPHVYVSGMRNNSFFDKQPPGGAFAIWAVLERFDTFDDDHGPKRLAILVEGGEGVATYGALFCQDNSYSPYAILLQDHGFGGNWTRFGGDESPLRTLALRSGLPRWLFVASKPTQVWSGYRVASSEDRGGCMRPGEGSIASPTNHRLVGNLSGDETVGGKNPCVVGSSEFAGDAKPGARPTDRLGRYPYCCPSLEH